MGASYGQNFALKIATNCAGLSLILLSAICEPDCELYIVQCIQ